jgi:protein TonB
LFVDLLAEITLLVRVESDGRVTDSRVEAGSGQQRLDEAAQRCLRNGSFEPRRINGAPVASWLRVHWPAA